VSVYVFIEIFAVIFLQMLQACNAWMILLLTRNSVQQLTRFVAVGGRLAAAAAYAIHANCRYRNM